MDIQFALTLAIVIIFWAFVSLIISDLINRFVDLYISPATVISIAQPQIVSKPAVSVIVPHSESISNPWEEVEPQQVTDITTQFEEILDPWKLELDFSSSMVKTQSVVLPFPALRLLPPASKVQLKRRGRPKKATSTAKTKSEKAESSRKPGRPRKKIA